MSSLLVALPEESLDEAARRFLDAVAQGNLDQVRALYHRHGSHIAHTTSLTGETPLHLASANGQLDVVIFLVEQCGANVHAVTALDHCTPLHLASWHGHLELVQYFVESSDADMKL
jgi:ankyrin repeat protein